MKKASQTNWLANINPNSQTAVCQVRLFEQFLQSNYALSFRATTSRVKNSSLSPISS